MTTAYVCRLLPLAAETRAAPADDRYQKIGHDAAAIGGRFMDLFLEAHPTPPGKITASPAPRAAGVALPPTVQALSDA